MFSRTRKTLAVIASVALLALMLPASTFAATQNGDTPESITIASTVSMTVPGAQDLTYNGSQWAWSGDVTVVGTNNPTGATITMTAEDFTSGAIVIPANQRNARCEQAASTTYPLQCSTAGGPFTFVGAGGPLAPFTNSSTVVPVAASGVALANESINLKMYVLPTLFTVGGVYTSTSHFTIVTN